MCIVYCVTNVKNGKRYVGWTNKTLEQRWKMHVRNALVRKRKFLLSEAIRKHGPGDEVWTLEILQEVTTPEGAKLLEVKFIAEFNTNHLAGGHGYNMTPGGDGCVLSGPANPFYGRKHSPETIEKIRQTIGDNLTGENNPQWGKRGELSPSWGKRHSHQTIERITTKTRGQKRTVEQRDRMRAANARNKNNRSEAQKRRRERERQERASLYES